jgi:hypothetical protein
VQRSVSRAAGVRRTGRARVQAVRTGYVASDML